MPECLYIVFGGSAYYPAGGVKDWIGVAQTIEDALTLALQADVDWWQVVDKKSYAIVREGVIDCYNHKPKKEG